MIYNNKHKYQCLKLLTCN